MKLNNLLGYKLFFSAVFVLLLDFSSYAQVEFMSYNVRYANETDGENSWSKRKEYITNQLEFYEPDIFGVQEALLEQMQYFKSNLENYKYIGIGRNDGKKGGEFTAIFYDSSKFKMLQENTFWLSETPEKVSTGWDAALPRICTYALFQKKDSGDRFWVFNTHFDHVGEKARDESVKLILSKIERINKKNLPVVLMGDFNLEPETQSIQYLSDKLKDSKEISKDVFGPSGTFNAFNFEEPVTRRIDYIFVNDKVKVLKYAVLSDSKDRKYPSDHFPVFVELKLK